MRSSMVFKQLAAAGMASLALASATTSPASAETFRAGIWQKEGHDFTIRTSASTSASKISTIKDPDTRVPCGGERCTRNNDGGSYTCWSGGPSGNDWYKVHWAGKTGWVAAWCVEVGRI